LTHFEHTKSTVLVLREKNGKSAKEDEPSISSIEESHCLSYNCPGEDIILTNLIESKATSEIQCKMGNIIILRLFKC